MTRLLRPQNSPGAFKRMADAPDPAALEHALRQWQGVISPDIGSAGVGNLKKLLAAHIPNFQGEPLLALAFLTAITSNVMAQCLLALEGAVPITDPVGDARVTAAKNVIGDVLASAIRLNRMKRLRRALRCAFSKSDCAVVRAR